MEKSSVKSSCAHNIEYNSELRTRLYLCTVSQFDLFCVPGPNKNCVPLSDIITDSACQPFWVIIIAAVRLNLLQTHSKALQCPLFPSSLKGQLQIAKMCRELRGKCCHPSEILKWPAMS